MVRLGLTINVIVNHNQRKTHVEQAVKKCISFSSGKILSA
jgi:hypothetical protein